MYILIKIHYFCNEYPYIKKMCKDLLASVMLDNELCPTGRGSTVLELESSWWDFTTLLQTVSDDWFGGLSFLLQTVLDDWLGGLSFLLSVSENWLQTFPWTRVGISHWWLVCLCQISFLGLEIIHLKHRRDFDKIFKSKR